MDLDPKGANNQIKDVIDRQYASDDEEVVVCLDSSDVTATPAAADASATDRIESMDADDHSYSNNNLHLGVPEVSI